MADNNTGVGGNQNEGNKSGGLSWSMPPATANKTQSSLPMSASQPIISPLQAQQKSTLPTTRSTASENNGKGKLLGAFLGGLVVGGLLVGGWYSIGPGTPLTGEENTNANATPGTGTTGNMNTGVASGVNLGGNTSSGALGAVAGNVSIASPIDTGLRVPIIDATVSEPTWLVVYELVGGQLGRALGAAMFFPEYNGKGGVVSLLRATLPAQTYVVGQSVDDGDHVFEPRADRKIVGTNGNPVLTTFRTK